MGMALNNLCNYCTNIGCEFQSGIVRTKCAFYKPPHIEPDNCGNYVVMCTTNNTTTDRIEIGTDGNLYRLIISNGVDKLYTKADVVAMFEELKKEIDEIPINPNTSKGFKLGQATAYDKCEFLIRQKIDAIEEK